MDYKDLFENLEVDNRDKGNIELNLKIDELIINDLALLEYINVRINSPAVDVDLLTNFIDNYQIIVNHFKNDILPVEAGKKDIYEIKTLESKLFIDLALKVCDELEPIAGMSDKMGCIRADFLRLYCEKMMTATRRLLILSTLSIAIYTKLGIFK